jgi:diaminohydroxyphosphoribosylaminopyrimidine deaminase/5-amino-6-(5-phosphoribosylamino)uracil reductase
MLSEHEKYMQRCIELASLGIGEVSPNPMVGAVLVYEDRIIGEGFHQQYGKTHAEVNCINSVEESNRRLIPASTLYVSLEPCSHHGKTPPCVDLILKEGIKKVMIGAKDTSSKVNGSGIQKLRENQVEVIENILETACQWQNRRFFVSQKLKRPYVILKWAESFDGFIGKEDQQIKISNELTNRVVHKWRSEEDAIWVGANTVKVDNPQLNVRLWKGKNPTRVVYDKDLSLDIKSSIFDAHQQTIRYHSSTHSSMDFVYQASFISEILADLWNRNIGSVIVEGGPKLVNQFIRQNIFDEIRLIRSSLLLHNGVIAPKVPINTINHSQFNLSNDSIYLFTNTATI